MKKFIKVVVVIFFFFLIIFGGGSFYLSRGLDAGSKIIINELDLSLLEDGIYSGKYNSGRFSNKVLVEIKGNKIIDISIEEDLLFSRPEIIEELLNKILSEQSNKVDSITGATVSSKAYLKAIEDALRND